MSRLTKFSKLVFATLIAGSSLSTFVSSHSVQADTLDPKLPRQYKIHTTF